ncbi:MFS transporter [Pedobacter sp. JY14-1]|uniref:MFS transporter n=1 Tax=Pedobacter sp. JY14-1 TaxID=3034151 RepID=UPI0023E217D6|nr:MFS transporter [Pedobacter sp. JY14-1]
MKEFLKLYLDAYKGLSVPAWMLALVMLINRSGAMVVPFLGVYMVNHQHFSLTDTGTVLACFGIGAVAGNFIGGWLTDKFGHFCIQVGSLLATVPLFLILPGLKDIYSMSVGVFILSMFSEMFRPANSVAVAHYSTKENVVRSFSLNRMAINLGFSIGPALGGFLAAISYSWLFYGNAVAALLSGLLLFVYFGRIKDGSHQEERTEAENGREGTGLSPYRDIPFLFFSFLCCVFAICFLQLLSTIPLYYRVIYHMGEAEIGMILAFSGFVVFALEMLVVHIAEQRLSVATILIWGTLLCAFSFLVLNLSQGIPLLYFSIFVVCLAEILAMPFMSTVTLRRSSVSKRGAYMGVNALSFSFAHIFSPLAGTRIADHYGFDTLWYGTVVALVFTAAGFFFVMKYMNSHH